MPGCNTPEQNQMVTRARQLMATYNDMAELIRLGAYRKGSDPEVDAAIFYNDKLESFLRQQPAEASTLESGYQELAKILGTRPAMPNAAPTPLPQGRR
jgi:flagellum-specific ATP synthase